MTAKKFKALSADQQIEVLLLQEWRRRREAVQLMKFLEHIDVLTLSREKLGKYLDAWRDMVKEVESFVFAEWSHHRNEQQGLNFNNLTPAEQERLVEELCTKWNATPDPIKAKWLRLSLKRPQFKSSESN
jgi:hypothetical protein